jgi:hypothetical protein
MQGTIFSRLFTASVCVFIASGAAAAATWHVGPGQAYAKPCAAIAAAASGDTILIDAAGSYNGDVCQWYKNGLSIHGFNGRPHIDAAGKSAGGKAIWVISGNDTMVDNIEFSGAQVVDGNGAGIKLEGVNLTVRNCYFHNNQAGFLTSNPGTGDVLIEFSEFAFNGAGDGQTHNVYIGHMGKLTFQFNYSHDSVGGQLLKTRAAENHVLYNRLSGEKGTTGYELDISNGGLSYVIGNVIEQGLNDLNHAMLAYMREGSSSLNPIWQLYVVNNTFVNSLSVGTFLSIGTADTIPVVATNNIFYGRGTISSQAATILSHNLVSTDPKFVNPAGFDYRLQSGSPAIDAGVGPGGGYGQSLTPVYQYVHPTCGQPRLIGGLRIDIGAFEYGNTATPISCAPTTTSPALSSIAVKPASLQAGATASVVAQLSQPAPAGGAVITLTSSAPTVASTAATITIPAGSTSGSALVTTGGVVATTTVTFSATYAGTSQTATLTVNP